MFSGAGFFPQTFGLVRPHAGTAKALRQETAHGEGVVANFFGFQAMFRSMGEQRILRIFGQQLRTGVG